MTKTLLLLISLLFVSCDTQSVEIPPDHPSLGDPTNQDVFIVTELCGYPVQIVYTVKGLLFWEKIPLNADVHEIMEVLAEKFAQAEALLVYNDLDPELIKLTGINCKGVKF